MGESQAEIFERDGFLVVNRIYDAEEMVSWKEAVVRIMREEGSLDNLPSGVRVWMLDELHPFFRERMKDPCVIDVLRRVVGPDLEFLSVKAVYKNRSTTFESPWHQDWYYWRGASKISIWIALDDANSENGCLKMIPGSHKKRFDVQKVKETTGFGWRAESEALEDLPVVTLEVACGDAVFFHDQMLHSSYPNRSGTDRWSMISTYRDASVADDSTSWDRSMLVSGLSVNG